MHIYRYASYEATAIKRLMGLHATREDEVDHLLRSEVAGRSVRRRAPGHARRAPELFDQEHRGVLHEQAGYGGGRGRRLDRRVRAIPGDRRRGAAGVDRALQHAKPAPQPCGATPAADEQYRCLDRRARSLCQLDRSREVPSEGSPPSEAQRRDRDQLSSAVRVGGGASFGKMSACLLAAGVADALGDSSPERLQLTGEVM
jgi:hypothetical protein